MKVRQPTVAGSFYPGEASELRRLVEEFLKEAKPSAPPAGGLKGLILPHASYIFSGPIAATGFKLLQIQLTHHLRGGRRDSSEVKADEHISRVVILGPNHFYPTLKAATAPYKFWQTPLGQVKVDHLAFDLVKEGKLESSILAHQGEHSIEVMLPFLQVVLDLSADRRKNFSLVPILTGESNPQDLAKILLPHLDKHTLLIVSSDLSHFLPYEEAQRIDKKTCQLIEKLEVGEFLKIGDSCGNLAIATLMTIAKQKNWRLQLLDYRTSGDTAGEKSQVVGYGSFACHT